MSTKKLLGSRKRKVVAGAVALMVVAGSAGAFVVSAQPTPATHEEALKQAEQKFGKPPPAPPSEDALKEQLAQVEATMRAQPSDAPVSIDDWQKAELLKQQITFAEHAPSPMPTGHVSKNYTGNPDH